LEENNIDNLNSDKNKSELDCLEFQCTKDVLIFGYFHNNFTIKLFPRHINKVSYNWVDDSIDIDLSQILFKIGIKFEKLMFCNKITNADIVIMFIGSDHANYLIRYDTQMSQIMDFLSFPQTSYFIHRLSTKIDKYNDLDVVVDQNKTITIILINHSNDDYSLVCPSISELQSVLNDKFINAVQELFKYWLKNLSSILDQFLRDGSLKSPVNFFYNGVPVSKYLNFLFVHQYILLETIWDHCEKENSTSSLGNSFVEQLANLVNEYINESINALGNLVYCPDKNVRPFTIYNQL